MKELLEAIARLADGDWTYAMLQDGVLFTSWFDGGDPGFSLQVPRGLVIDSPLSTAALLTATRTSHRTGALVWLPGSVRLMQ